MKWDVIDTHDGRLIAEAVSFTEAEQWVAQSERAVMIVHRQLGDSADARQADYAAGTWAPEPAGWAVARYVGEVAR